MYYQYGHTQAKEPLPTAHFSEVDKKLISLLYEKYGHTLSQEPLPQGS